MRKKVLSYSNVLEELKKDNYIISVPLSNNDYMIIDNEMCTVRNDFYTKAYRQGYLFKRTNTKDSFKTKIELKTE